MFTVAPNGEVSTPSYPETLHLVKVGEKNLISIEKRLIFCPSSREKDIEMLLRPFLRLVLGLIHWSEAGVLSSRLSK